MSISSISAAGGAYNNASNSAYNNAYSQAAPASTRSVTQLASGATVTTIRGTTGAVLAVSTAAAQKPVSRYSVAALPETSTLYATA